MPRKKKTEEAEEKKEVSEGEVDEANKKVEAKAEKEAAKNKKEKLAELLKKAKKLEAGVEEVKEVNLAKEVKGEEKETLVPIEDYLKASIHLGTRVITPDMRKYVYKRRADGLAVFNTNLIDDKMREAIDYLSQFEPKDVIVVCKREAGWKAVSKFSEITGIRAFMKKYPAGILTNPVLETFTETELIFVCDPWIDKNAMNDALRIKVPVLAICDTNNYTQDIGKMIIGNNKSAKSFGIIFYLLTKYYVEKRKLGVAVPPVQDFIDDWDNLVPPK